MSEAGRSGVEFLVAVAARILSGAIMLTNTELFGSVDTEAMPNAGAGAPGDDSGSALGQNTMQKYQKWVMRGSALMFIPLTSGFPSGLLWRQCMGGGALVSEINQVNPYLAVCAVR